MKKLLFLTLFLSISVNSYSQEWQLIGSWNNDEYTSYYDLETFKGGILYTEVTEKIVYNTDYEYEGKLIDYVILRMRYFCNEKQREHIEKTAFYKDGTKEDFIIEEKIRIDLKPGSYGDMFLKFFCE